MDMRKQDVASGVKRTLREWRAFKKLDKKDIASGIGVHPGTYAKWEDNPQEIRIKDAVRLAEFFGCEVGAIIFFESNPNFKLDFVGEGNEHIAI